MSFPASWADSVFARLSVRYGASWARMWDGIPMQAVRDDWCEQLTGFERNPDAIRYALDNLPVDRPPNATQFRALCISAPEPELKRLPPPPQVDREAAQRCRELKVQIGAVDPKAWAYALRKRELMGDRLTKAQRDMWRAALNPVGSMAEGEFA